MSDKVWKAQEIPQLCPHDIASEAEVHVKAINNKIDRIIFLVQRLSSSDTSIPTNFNTTVLRSSQLEVEIYTESIATNLHSLADVLAHVINVIVLKPLQTAPDCLNSRQISIHNVKNKLSSLRSLDSVRDQYIAEIVREIDKLIDSSEFRYIAAFVNTIKHRSLLDTEFTLTIQSGSLMDIGYRLDPFDYEGNCFPQTQCRVVAMDYREKVIDLVFDVGNSINNYCRAVFLMSV
ncbi:hypothetical protein H6G94_21865 [Nostoc punctiforme FACHB-252]|uniref:Uncharacterized protein n=1 Tax=Nostoc punctiforme FACHB-252 TaxID=1357509 RepID=A0ABR8HF01_NOSPU|nr:hypothetical protein [Nostoc punctiforme]MBD2613889.1 hypothetical protein [Nostoc punctiforme FACHB-252]